MYPPHHFGGYELVWRSAMRHLVREGHEVTVLTTDFDSGAREADDPNVHRELRWYWRNHEFPSLTRRDRVGLERWNARVVDRHLAERRPDVVSWWSMGGMSLSLLERVRRTGVPSVAFVHDDWLDYGRHVDGWLRPFEGRFRRLARIADRLSGIPTRVDLETAARYVFVSDTTRRRARDAGVAPRDTGIAHSGIDPSFIGPAPERQWTWSLLYVGRLDVRKGVHTAIEALVDLPEARLSIVGGWDSKEERRLRALAESIGVDARVLFAGQRTREEVRAAYDDADVVLFPVVWEEPWGLVPIEGMARGRPVVATGRGGSGEYLRDGENCVLFPAEDAPALARAVLRLADDPALRTRLREQGIDTARQHTETVFNDAVERELRAAAISHHPERAAKLAIA
jgi:glycosyltransferase involved in cell wall biosynthesis